MDRVSNKIVAETNALAATYKAEFNSDPFGELCAWLEIAARREAMVREVYGAAQRNARLSNSECAAARTAWDALNEIWQQEAVHTELIRCRLSEGAFSSRWSTLRVEFLQLLGDVEGRLLCTLTRERATLGQALARLAMKLGAVVTPDLLPPVVLELESLNAREFFGLAAALELTARQSYERMLELLDLVSKHMLLPSVQLLGLRREIARVRLDELFHEQTFALMATWTHGSGEFDSSLGEAECVTGISRLLPRATEDVRGPSSGKTLVVATDGCLGRFFKRHGIDLVVRAEV